MRPGRRNLITDVTGLSVGNASDARLKSGATVLVGERPFIAAVSVMGGAPGTRETDLLAPDRLVQEVDALVLSGGSAFGLDAASGVACTSATMGAATESRQTRLHQASSTQRQGPRWISRRSPPLPVCET